LVKLQFKLKSIVNSPPARTDKQRLGKVLLPLEITFEDNPCFSAYDANVCLFDLKAIVEQKTQRGARYINGFSFKNLLRKTMLPFVRRTCRLSAQSRSEPDVEIEPKKTIHKQNNQRARAIVALPPARMKLQRSP